jgi:two-component system chemotaxis response regulator CheB
VSASAAQPVDAMAHAVTGEPPIVVVGASAGGVEALVGFVASLPSTFPAAVLVVLHIAPSSKSVLPQILARAGHVPVRMAVNDEPLVAGEILVAPPDHHLLIEDGRVRLSQMPRENGHRPAIDPTMRSASAARAGGVVGIVLSGTRDDGTAGLRVIKEGGGTTMVQDPEEALYPSMILSAQLHVELDAVLPVSQMATWIEQHAFQAPADHPAQRESARRDVARDLPGGHPPGVGTRFACPDCGGTLFEREEGGLLRFECSVGHVLSIESLADEQARSLETALWAAVRSLDDRAVLLRRMSQRARVAGRPRAAEGLDDQAERAGTQAQAVRVAIERSHGA